MKGAIGILGAGGKVGRGATDILSETGPVIAGGRNPISCGENITFRKTDIFDDASLDHFVHDLDVVINCAGPACVIGDRVARAAKRYGATYIDVAGNASMVAEIRKNCADNGTYIVSAGVYPGLCEMFFLWVNDRHKGTTASIEELFYGRSKMSDTALEDIARTVAEGEGKAFCYMKDGKRQMLDINVRQSTKIRGCEEEIFLMPMLYSEFEDMCGKDNMPPKAMFCQGMDRPDAINSLAALRDDPSKAGEIFNTGSEDGGFYIAADLSFKDDEPDMRYVLCSSEDWNYMSGAVAAAVALKHKEGSQGGLKFASSLEVATDIVEFLREKGLITIKRYSKKK